MVLKKYLLSAACLLAMQGAMAQVDGVTGASVQAANTSCCTFIEPHPLVSQE